MQEILGTSVLILDSADAIAEQVNRVLISHNLKTSQVRPKHLFYTTGNPVLLQEFLAKNYGFQAIRNSSIIHVNTL